MKTIVNVAIPSTMRSDLDDLEFLHNNHSKKPFPRQSWARWIRNRNYCVFFYRFNGNLIGCGLTRSVARRRSPHRGEILRLFILERQHPLHAVKLLQEMEQHLIRRGAAVLLAPGLNHYMNRSPLVMLLVKHGYDYGMLGMERRIEITDPNATITVNFVEPENKK